LLQFIRLQTLLNPTNKLYQLGSSTGRNNNIVNNYHIHKDLYFQVS
jgi:hypothetical protein